MSRLKLRRKNNLMKRGLVEVADRITARIRLLLPKQNTLTFSSTARGSKELWSEVREVTGKNRSNDGQSLNFSASILNEHYASVSNDGKYTPSLRKPTEPIEGSISPDSK